jgi:hypothetical protein
MGTLIFKVGHLLSAHNTKELIMKLLFTISMLLSLNAFADITVISSPIQATAINGPDGLLQLLGPTIEVNKQNFPLLGDADTAKWICVLIGKNESVGFSIMDQPDGMGYRFDTNGIIKSVNFKTLSSLEDNAIGVVSCK